MNLSTDCELVRLNENVDLTSFSCGISDLDEFLLEDSNNYSSQLLGVTYLFVSPSTQAIIAFFTVSNASLNLKDLPNTKKKKVDGEIPHNKRRKSYPSVLLGRLGVASKFQKLGIGEQVLDFLKYWFRYENKTGCRFIIVDAYNNTKVLNFYEKNDFKYIQTPEDETKQLIKEKNKEDVELLTRHMYYDLARFEG